MMPSRLHLYLASISLLAGISSAHAAPAPAPPDASEITDTTDEGEDETGGGGFEIWTDTDAADADAPAEPKAGDVLYHASWYGHGLTTILADIFFFRQMGKVEAACKEAGGELKNVKIEVSGIFYYYISGTGDCVKK